MNYTNSSLLTHDGRLPGVAYWALKSIISFVAVFGNGVVMWLICTRRRLHCTANWFVLSLASADFCIGLLITPSELICLWKPAACIWPINVRSLFYNYPINASICCLCVLTFDRYLCVLSPLKYTSRMTSKKVVALITLSWILPGILTFVSLMWMKAPTNTQETADKVHTIIQIFLVTFLPSIFLVYSYTRIFFAALRHRRLSAEQISQLRFNQEKRTTKRIQTQRSRECSSTVKVLGVVIAFFVLCWIPSLYRAICGMFVPCSIYTTVIQISRLLILLNSGLNFVVYAFLKKDIRSELCKTLRKARGGSRENFPLTERSSRESNESRTLTSKSLNTNPNVILTPRERPSGKIRASAKSDWLLKIA